MNGAVSMVNKGKPHHSFVHTLYMNISTFIYEQLLVINKMHFGLAFMQNKHRDQT